jgi:hypothetical protein
METIKPGTRCECRDKYCTHGWNLRCIAHAVRLVTVQLPTGHEEFGRKFTYPSEVPMCEPCAQFHEAKAGAR